MKFALFYEIPVARPWTRDAEYQAYRDTLAERDGTYDYLDAAKQAVDSRLHELASLDVLLAGNMVIAGDPDEVIQRCKAYEATGADLLLCLVNPYKIPHAQVMETIELMGKYVLPEFDA